MLHFNSAHTHVDLSSLSTNHELVSQTYHQMPAFRLLMMKFVKPNL